MFIQCKGPEARTAASFSVSRQREATALSSSEEDPDSTAAVSRNCSSGRPTNSGSSGSTSSSSGGGGYSYFNAAEAEVVVECVQRLLATGLQAQDVCVITPYRWGGVSI